MLTPDEGGQSAENGACKCSPYFGCSEYAQDCPIHGWHVGTRYDASGWLRHSGLAQACRTCVTPPEEGQP